MTFSPLALSLSPRSRGRRTWWPAGARLSLDFVQDRYQALGAPAETLQDLPGAECLRSGPATVPLAADANGARVQSVAADTPRLGLGGLWIEPAATNLFTHSQSLTPPNWRFFGATSAPSGEIAPDGTPVSVVTVAATSSFVGELDGQSVLTSTAPYTFSVYVKGLGSAVGRRIVIGNYGNGNYETLRLPLPGVWTRLSITVTPSGTTNNALFVQLSGPAGGKLAELAIGEQIALWGAQAEPGPNLSTLIPTGGAAATRAADRISLGTQALFSAYGTTALSGHLLDAPASGEDGYTLHRLSGDAGDLRALLGDTGALTVRRSAFGPPETSDTLTLGTLPGGFAVGGPSGALLHGFGESAPLPLAHASGDAVLRGALNGTALPDQSAGPALGSPSRLHLGHDDGQGIAADNGNANTARMVLGSLHTWPSVASGAALADLTQ